LAKALVVLDGIIHLGGEEGESREQEVEFELLGIGCIEHLEDGSDDKKDDEVDGNDKVEHNYYKYAQGR
jgi:extradiol dioxygenase family protein